MDTNPFYTLTDARNYTVRRLLRKAGHEPVPAMVNILRASGTKGGYVIRPRYPSADDVREAARGFARMSSTAKATPEQSYTAGWNACKRAVAELNSEEAILLHEAQHKVMRPIDMTLRQLAFVAHTCNADSMALIREIAGVTSPDVDMMENVRNWRTEYMIESHRHEETKRLAAQRADELEGASRRIAQLRDALHREGIQDPTVQIAVKAGGDTVGILHEGHAEASHPQGTPTGRGSEDPVRDNPE